MKPLILIVEDELIIALHIKEILKEEGFDAIINVDNVNDAITTIENLNPSLVLIDISLRQDKDGVHLGAFLLERDKIPFIYITSYSDKSTLERVRETRPYGYIVKPFKPTDLKSTVDIVLHNFKHRNIDVLRQDKEISNDIPFILKQSLKYINDNVNEKIKISDLANQTRWESQHFNRLFTQYIGSTPYKYIMDKKIEKAKTLLIETKIPIVQLSFDLGFKSHSNFCSIFKKVTGKTPENFRKWYEVTNKYLK
ncbi:response regulator transcription factor [Flavobacterium sp.]|jgi:YesN/AraC family two-component response regulator|uniref:response regulator transcription factor n=1 Tax=Flavobacterium sp. TaxID=239 RepID=UPI0037C1B2EE